MNSDYRLKYIASQIANSSNSGIIDNPINDDNAPDNLEPFEGGIHVNNARFIFIIFAAIILILYIIES